MPSPKPSRRSVSTEALADGLSHRIIEVIRPCTNSQVGRLLGVSDETVRRIRHGDQPSVRVVMGLCQAFNISADWLLLGRGDAPVIDHQSIIETKTRGLRLREYATLTTSR